MRQPMEEMYGAEVFAKTWEAWVDGVAQFAKRPKGTEFMLLQTHYTGEVEQSKTEKPPETIKSRDGGEMFCSHKAITKAVVISMLVKY